MGLSAIVRGTVPLQCFGPAGYGAMLGRLSAPGLAIRAAAPLAFVVMMERAGLSVSAAVLVALSDVAALALLLLARGGYGRGLGGRTGLCERHAVWSLELTPIRRVPVSASGQHANVGLWRSLHVWQIANADHDFDAASLSAEFA